MQAIIISPNIFTRTKILPAIEYGTPAPSTRATGHKKGPSDHLGWASLPQLTDINRTVCLTASETLRQLAAPHQVTVALTGGSAALVKSPHNEALAATTVSGGEDTRDTGTVFFEFSLDITALILFQA